MRLKSRNRRHPAVRLSGQRDLELPRPLRNPGRIAYGSWRRQIRTRHSSALWKKSRRGGPQVDLDFNVSLGPYEKKTYRIEYGPGVKAAPQPEGITVESGPNVFGVVYSPALRLDVLCATWPGCSSK